MTLQEKLDHNFVDASLLERALTHKSYYNENRAECAGHNERLEFLGDAVLDTALSEILFRQYPDFSEGQLSKIRASFVNEGTLAEYGREFEVDQHMRLGRGETQSGGAEKPRLLASAFEAVIGALFLDTNYEVVRDFTAKVYQTRLSEITADSHFDEDYKTRFQEAIQEREKKTPLYEVTSEQGPDHQKKFHVNVKVDERTLGTGSGKSKKQAEQEAARVALENLK